jgi:hypothetical protein
VENKNFFVIPKWCLGEHEIGMVSVGADDQALKDPGSVKDAGWLRPHTRRPGEASYQPGATAMEMDEG